MDKLLADNTALSMTPCERKLQLAVFEGLHVLSKTATDFGSAFHSAMELMDKGADPEVVVAKVFAEAPNVDKVKLLNILIKSKTSMQMPPALVLNGTPMIEHKFRFEYDPFIDLCGTIDRVHEEIKPGKDDILVPTDYKTSASATESAITKTRREYEMSFQLLFYLHALATGILPAALVAQYITGRRYRLDIRIAFYNSENTPLKVVSLQPVSSTFLSQEIPAIIANRIFTLTKVADMHANNQRAPMTGRNIYGYCLHCEFRHACMVAHTSREQEILNNFARKPYNPMTFR